MALAFFHCFVSAFYILTFLSTCSSAKLSVENPKTQAEKLIRAFNLFPQQDVNIVANDPKVLSTITPKIVENQVRFPYLADSEATVQDLGHHAGYFQLPHTKGARMFYYFFESRNNKSDPVVIWLSGGPGCSGSLALFYENGPFHITDDLSLAMNDFGWDKVSNIIYVDQPTGTGFSYTSNRDDIRVTSQQASNDLYDFLQAFFKEHREYAINDFYITGESYAGHYIAALAARIQLGNNNKEGIHINLKGLAIGNGLTDPGIQYAAYTDYALEMNLIQQSDYDRLNSSVPFCEKQIKLCGTTSTSSSCSSAYQVCTSIFNSIVRIAGNINYYDIRKECEGSLCYDFSSMEQFLNQDTVKEALGVRGIQFVSCSSTVYDAMVTDWMKNFEVDIPAMLQTGVKLLVYAGEHDLICNWLGNSRWVEAMVWPGQKDFTSIPLTPFMVDNVEAGLQKSHGPLTFLKVHDAGHLVPMDQPKASLEMLTRWMQGRLL